MDRETKKQAPKFWNMAALSDEEAEIILYGDICSAQPTDWFSGEPLPGLFITPEGFLEDLDAVRGKASITIRLNSTGGDLYTGIAIHNALKNLSGKKRVVVEGIAASAASVIACAGDTVAVHPGSLVMIHGVAGLLYGYYNTPELKQIMKGFDAGERAAAEIYRTKTGIDVETLRAMMAKETWMTGKEALDRGFADELIEGASPDIQTSADRGALFVNGIEHSARAFRNLPASIPVSERWVAQTSTSRPINSNKEGEKAMDTIQSAEELRRAYPELVAQIEQSAQAQAVAGERTRLQEIDSIAASVADAQLIAEAKYGAQSCTAQALAFRAMQQREQHGAQFLNRLASDSAASGAAQVAAFPNEGIGETDKSEAQELLALCAPFLQSKGGVRL